MDESAIVPTVGQMSFSFKNRKIRFHIKLAFEV
jgi:hypothetical protein